MADGLQPAHDRVAPVQQQEGIVERDPRPVARRAGEHDLRHLDDLAPPVVVGVDGDHVVEGEAVGVRKAQHRGSRRHVVENGLGRHAAVHGPVFELDRAALRIVGVHRRPQGADRRVPGRGGNTPGVGGSGCAAEPAGGTWIEILLTRTLALPRAVVFVPERFNTRPSMIAGSRCSASAWSAGSGWTGEPVGNAMVGACGSVTWFGPGPVAEMVANSTPVEFRRADQKAHPDGQPQCGIERDHRAARPRQQAQRTRHRHIKVARNEARRADVERDRLRGGQRRREHLRGLTLDADEAVVHHAYARRLQRRREIGPHGRQWRAAGRLVADRDGEDGGVSPAGRWRLHRGDGDGLPVNIDGAPGHQSAPTVSASSGRTISTGEMRSGCTSASTLTTVTS